EPPGPRKARSDDRLREAIQGRKERLDCFVACAPRNDGWGLMIVPRHAEGMRDVAVAGREFHTGAGRVLANSVAIELLPGRLVGGMGIAALRLQLGAAALEFILGNQDIGAPFIEINAYLVVGLQDCEATVRGSFWARVEDRRRA